MPNSKNNQHSTGKKKESLLPYGFKTNAERISAQYRKALGFKETDFLPSCKLVEYLQVLIKEVPYVEAISEETVEGILDGGFGTAFSAVTIYCPNNDRLMIVHNHTHSLARKESNIMHECAHIILEHRMEEFDNSNGYNLRSYDKAQEEQARYLGHCLQLPAAALKKYFVFENKSKEEIADIFTASKEVVNYRLRIAGIEAFKRNLDGRKR